MLAPASLCFGEGTSAPAASAAAGRCCAFSAYAMSPLDAQILFHEMKKNNSSSVFYSLLTLSRKTVLWPGSLFVKRTMPYESMNKATKIFRGEKKKDHALQQFIARNCRSTFKITEGGEGPASHPPDGGVRLVQTEHCFVVCLVWVHCLFGGVRKRMSHLPSRDGPSRS